VQVPETHWARSGDVNIAYQVVGDGPVDLDAAGSRKAAILTSGDASDLGLVFAATYPERVHAVVTWECQVRGTWAPDYPWAPPREEALRRIEEIEWRWSEWLAEEMARIAPSLDPSQQEAFVRVTRLSVSPGSAAAYHRMALDVDVRGILPSVRVPVLVMTMAGGPSEGRRPLGRGSPSGRRVRRDRPARLGARGRRHRTSPRADSALCRPSRRAR
jgi:pimeloyl-ACP methyl ester carboxylesterase